MIHIFNLRREKLDHVPKRTFKVEHLPPLVDLRDRFPPVFDQGRLGSCTANSLLGVFQFDDLTFNGSRLFLYFNERKMDGDVPEDAGSTISQGVKALTLYGVCEEQLWPYDINKFKVTPDSHCYKDGLLHKAITYEHVTQTEESMKSCLASGYPIALGIAVYESFESPEAAKTGNVPLPKEGEKELGGHAIVCCGYDDEKKSWIMRNSWGESWGEKGYFYLPYEYLTDANLCSDLWKITKVSHDDSNKPEPQPSRCIIL